MASSTANYSVFKAKVFWTPEGGTERDLGNVSELTLTPNITFLDHYSSRAGVKSKDLSAPTEIAGELSMTMDEITAENIAMAILGDVLDQETGDPGYVDAAPTQLKKVKGMTGTQIVGAIRVEGTNTVGRKVDAEIFRVAFKGGNSFSFISDEWAEIQLSGEILYSEADAANGGYFVIYEKN